MYPACAPTPANPGFLYDTGCNRKNLDDDAASKMNARVYTHLLYRHWTQYQGRRRSHLLIQNIQTGDLRDLDRGHDRGHRSAAVRAGRPRALCVLTR